MQDYINQIEQPAGTGSPQWPQAPNQQANPLQGFRQDEFAELQQPALIPSSDIKEHIRTHREQMPQITGPKAHALAAAVVIDQLDVPDNSAYQFSNLNQSGQQVQIHRQQAQASAPQGVSSVMIN